MHTNARPHRVRWASLNVENQFDCKEKREREREKKTIFVSKYIYSIDIIYVICVCAFEMVKLKLAKTDYIPNWYMIVFLLSIIVTFIHLKMRWFFFSLRFNHPKPHTHTHEIVSWPYAILNANVKNGLKILSNNCVFNWR